MPAPQFGWSVRSRSLRSPSPSRRNACSSTSRVFRLMSSARAARASSTAAIAAVEAGIATRRRREVEVHQQVGPAADRGHDAVAEQRRDREQHPVHVVALGPADLALVPLLEPADRRLGRPPPACPRSSRNGASSSFSPSASPFLYRSAAARTSSAARSAPVRSGAGALERLARHLPEREPVGVDGQPPRPAEVPARQPRGEPGALWLHALGDERLRRRTSPRAGGTTPRDSATGPSRGARPGERTAAGGWSRPAAPRAPSAARPPRPDSAGRPRGSRTPCGRAPGAVR